MLARRFLLVLPALLLLSACDDETTGPNPCALSAPVRIELDTLVTRVNATPTDSVTFMIRNNGTRRFSGPVALAEVDPPARPASLSLEPHLTELSLAAGESMEMTVVASVTALTSQGDHNWNLILGADCDTLPIHLFVRSSESGLLETLEDSWRRRDIDEYAGLFADDFRFYFDPDTRYERGLPEYWDRAADTSGVGKLFRSPEIEDIRIATTYDATPDPVIEVGREHWSLVTLSDEYLEVELSPAPGEQESITLVVDGQIQKFYFRQGRSEADRLSSSPTSGRLYITEWRDQGLTQIASRISRGIQSPEVAWMTWGRVKTLYR